jgi:TetR/AcrR family transcriptional repressor of nem operon
LIKGDRDGRRSRHPRRAFRRTHPHHPWPAWSGTEIGSQDERIRSKISEIFGRAQQYLESALRDLAAEGLPSAREVRATASAIHSCELGLLVRAKVANDPEVLRELGPAVRRLLGLKAPSRIAA